tara:strand:+ start:41434 stop:42612 length:1179 start_codon:yes stop_codon:yes gene_type:complete
MAVNNYESLDTNSDVTTTRTLLHEAIPLTGTIVSGTYGTLAGGGNIKNYTHGMFQSVYDYPYLSSSANHIFDITVGYDEGSSLSGSSSRVMQSKKINMYNQFSQVLLGYKDGTNTIEIFESDLDIGDDSHQMKECVFINFSRLLQKDQIKPGTFSLVVGTGSWSGSFNAIRGPDYPALVTLTDKSASATGTGTKNQVGGDYGVLYASGSEDGTEGSGYQSGMAADSSAAGKNEAYGVVFYQAGVVVLTSSLFTHQGSGSGAPIKQFYWNPAYGTSGSLQSMAQALTGAAISGACDAIRHRLYNLSFNNTTEINSKIYFCRVPHNKYNYSSNPTYTDGSKIRVKSKASDTPVAYITTIGLYNASNELLAVAKLSEPLRKDPTNDITLRVRLDY